MLLAVQIPFDQEWYRMLLVAQIPFIMTGTECCQWHKCHQPRMEENVDSGTNITDQEWYRMLLEVQILPPFIRYGLKSCQWHKDQWQIKNKNKKKENKRQSCILIILPDPVPLVKCGTKCLCYKATDKEWSRMLKWYDYH